MKEIKKGSALLVRRYNEVGRCDVEQAALSGTSSLLLLQH